MGCLTGCPEESLPTPLEKSQALFYNMSLILVKYILDMCYTPACYQLLHNHTIKCSFSSHPQHEVSSLLQHLIAHYSTDLHLLKKPFSDLRQNLGH